MRFVILVPKSIDPFQSVYKQISDDMQAYRLKLTEADVTRIRTVAEMVFARNFAPDAFSSYVESNKKGQITVKRLPAPDDPMLARIRKVREREYVFVDTLDEYFAEYQRAMYKPYQEWRQASYEEVVELEHLQAQARTRMLMGAAAIGAGIAGEMSDNSTAQAAGFEEGPRSSTWQAELMARGIAVVTGLQAATASEVLAQYAAQGGFRYNARAL